MARAKYIRWDRNNAIYIALIIIIYYMSGPRYIVLKK